MFARIEQGSQERIEGTRVRVQDICAFSEIDGKSPDEIVQALPHISLAQVFCSSKYKCPACGRISFSIPSLTAFVEPGSEKTTLP